MEGIDMHGIDLGSWSWHAIYDDNIKILVDELCHHSYSSTGIQTYICQIKFLLGRKFSDPELQLELDYVPFRVIEGPDGCPLVHGRCNGEDRAFKPIEILAMWISAARDYRSESSIMGVPIYFSDQQNKDVCQAATIAGLLESFCLVDETTATVVAYQSAISAIVPECIVAFVDIGHASMQVCFAEFKRRQFGRKLPVNILYKGYARSLGGREFDKILFKHFASKIRSKYKIDVYQSSCACVRLREACETLKHDLSKKNEASFCIEKLSGFIDVKGSITRKEFENLSISVLEKIEKALMKALTESGLNAEKIRFVEAVGRGCSVPSIIKIMVKILGKEPRIMPYDLEHIAQGCATDVSQLWLKDKTAGLSAVELVSCDSEVEEDSSDKLLWKRAMDKDGYSLPFLNDFLQQYMCCIKRTMKTEEESFWLSLGTKKTEEGSYGLSKAGSLRSFWKAWFSSTDSQQNTEHPKTVHTAVDKRVQNDEVEKLVEQLKSERDNARKEVEELRRLNMEIPRSQYIEFSYSDLQDATNNFQESLKLGEGGFGIVYKGIIHETTVAIKVLKDGSSQGEQEFNQEVAALSMVRHPNLVTLIGACSETRALIYEYLPQGSLEDHLRCKNNTSPLPWQARVRIAFEICTALSFLHHCKPHGIVHGDLKPDNILLDSNNISKISDFGLCRQLNWTDSASIAYHWTDCPKGTLAYMDPEYLSTGKITPQYDVYSFGIMLLRLVTCKEPRGLRLLVEDAKKKGTLNTLVDATAGPWPFKEANKMILLGLRCSDLVRKNRPDLSTKVLKEMKSMLDIASASASS